LGRRLHPRYLRRHSPDHGRPLVERERDRAEIWMSRFATDLRRLAPPNKLHLLDDQLAAIKHGENAALTLVHVGPVDDDPIPVPQVRLHAVAANWNDLCAAERQVQFVANERL